MKIQINATNVEFPAAFEEFIESRLNESLKAFEQQLTRVEVHLKDENGNKGGVDKRCLLEARLRGMDPIAVEHTGIDVTDALRKAADKLRSALRHRLGKMSER